METQMLLGSVDGVACLFWFCFVPPINLMNDWKRFFVPGFSQQLNRTGLTVTIKKIRLGTQKEGVNFTALGEIKLLKELQDPNIIEPIDAFHHKGNLHLVFEFMETDLEAVIRDRNIVLLLADVKSYLQMTLMGLAYFHKKWVLHRYMKPNNLLIGPHGRLKLGDFGLARLFGSHDRRFIHQAYASFLLDIDPCLSMQVNGQYVYESLLDGIGHLSCCLVPRLMVLLWMCGLQLVYLLSSSYANLFCRSGSSHRLWNSCVDLAHAADVRSSSAAPSVADLSNFIYIISEDLADLRRRGTAA